MLLVNDLLKMDSKVMQHWNLWICKLACCRQQQKRARGGQVSNTMKFMQIFELKADQTKWTCFLFWPFFVHTDRPLVETIVRKRLFVPLDWVKSNKHVWHYYLLHFYSHWTIMAQSYSEWYDVERRSIWPFYFGLGKTWCLLS